MGPSRQSRHAVIKNGAQRGKFMNEKQCPVITCFRIFLIIIMIIASEAAAVDLTSSCVLQYKMNENDANTTVIDSQGFSNGTAQQNTSILHTTGKVGGALTFTALDIYNGDFIDTNSNFNTIFQNSFSVLLWCKPNDGQFTSWNERLFGLSNNNPEIWLEKLSSGKIHLDYRVDNEGETVDLTSPNAVFIDGQETWHFLAVVAEKLSVSTMKAYLYFDGDLIATSSTYNIPMGDWNATAKLFIGAESLAGCEGELFSGFLDNVMIFNKAISTDEIAFLWNEGNGTESLKSPDIDNASLTAAFVRNME
jgi:hypothetical protein